MIFLPDYVQRLRKEVRHLRIHNEQLKRSHIYSQGKISKLSDDIKRLKEEKRRLEKEKRHLARENEKLKKEIEKLTSSNAALAKTNLRYQISLFDHGNFKHKDNSSKKPKGGQLSHKDTNRENQEDSNDYANYSRKRIFAKFCGHCGTHLKRTQSIKQKVLLDIVIKPELVKLIIESERQWCSKCKKEVLVKDPQTLPFTEYGLNTFMMIMILRFKGHLSFLNISSVFSITLGLFLSKSDISNILTSASSFLGSEYEELVKEVRKGEVIYADETGWLVHGEKAWMWIMANEKETVYLAAESRGKGIAEELYGNSQAFCMTDGLYSYSNTIPKDKHLYCWAHILRFAYEETVKLEATKDAVFLRDQLVRIYHLKKKHPQYSKDKLERVLRYELEKLLSLKSNQEAFNKIQNRVREQKEGLILSLVKTSSGTNNLAERELRPMVLNRKVSFGSDTYTGMKTSAILGSVIQTMSRDKEEDLLTELELSLQIGIHQKYPQYHHIAYYDTS